MLGRRVTLICSIAALVLTGAACGGDDDDDDAGGGASNISKEDFIEQADAICADFNERASEIGEGLADDASPDEVAEVFLDEGLPLFREQIEQLRGLDLPEADADDLEQLWDDLESSTDDLEQQLQDDPEATLTGDEDPFEDEDAFATEYGMKECGGS